MWFMPSYGRPHRLGELLLAPGGWPEYVAVLVNRDDPYVRDYFAFTRLLTRPWLVTFIPEKSRCADAHRWFFERYPDKPFYGLLCDDQWPVTPGWWKRMEDAADGRFVVTPAGERNFPLCRTAVCLGGDLVRAMGSIVPCGVKHNFEDNIWDDVGREHGLLRALSDVVVEHRHWIGGQAEDDETYRRGRADFEEDRVIYEAWLKSEDKKAMDDRIRELIA